MDIRLINDFCDSMDTHILQDLTPPARKFFLEASKYVQTTRRGHVDLANLVVTELESTLKILNWNVNGMRSNIVGNKKWNKCKGLSAIEFDSNLGELVYEHDPDILCFQETRCDQSVAGCIQIAGYHQYWSCSKGSGARAGNRYSGTSLWSKIKPDSVSYNIPTLPEPDQEGRAIVAEYDKFTLITTYVPNAGTNFDYRTQVWDVAIRDYLAQLRRTGKNVIWCGDLNVARTPNDVFFGDPESSRYNKAAMKGTGYAAVGGFTKEEREGFERILDEGYLDVYRELYPNQKDAYTWWNQRAPGFRAVNLGWRLDYFILNARLMPCVIDMLILKHAGLCTKPQGSDHAAILLELRMDCLDQS
jgi:exodeoxyribonuclease III